MRNTTVLKLMKNILSVKIVKFNVIVNYIKYRSRRHTQVLTDA